MFIIIRGGGDIASGIALRLYRSGMDIVICEVPSPTSIRRTVCFSEAIRLGETTVEGITARRAELEEIPELLEQGIIPVLTDPDARCVPLLEPDAVVDAILAKRNLGTTLDMAPAVIAAGPGFTAGIDCDAVVETMRGHYLGRVIYDGSALPNTAVPGLIGGYARAHWKSAAKLPPGRLPVLSTALPCAVPSAARCGVSLRTAFRSLPV